MITRTPELNILGIAGNVIAHLRLTSADVKDFNPLEFCRRTRSAVAAHVQVMTLEKLGWVIANAVSPEHPTPYRKTSVADVEGKNRFIEWTGHGARNLLTEMAMSVIIAAMYDILASRFYAEVQEGPVPRSIAYQPTPSMEAFIHRLRNPQDPKPARPSTGVSKKTAAA